MSNGLHIQTLLHHYTTVFSYGFIFLACLTLLVFMVLLPRSIWISKRFTAVCIHHHVRYPAHVVVSCKVNGVVGRGWLNCALVPWTLVSSVHTPDLTCFEQIYVPFLTYATLSLMGREIDACFVCLLLLFRHWRSPLTWPLVLTWVPNTEGRSVRPRSRPPRDSSKQRWAANGLSFLPEDMLWMYGWSMSREDLCMLEMSNMNTVNKGGGL